MPRPWGLPEGWNIAAISEISIFKFLSNNIDKFDDTKGYHATADVEGTCLLEPSEYVSYSSRPSRAQNEPVLHSVWFARMKNTYKILGFTSGNSSVISQIIFSTGFVGFHTEQQYFSFLYQTISSLWFHDIKDLYTTGATQESLTNNGLNKIKIILPSKKMIIRYGELAYPILQKIHGYLEINRKLITSRDRLLSRLMSGKIDVENLNIQFPKSMMEEDAHA